MELTWPNQSLVSLHREQSAAPTTAYFGANGDPPPAPDPSSVVGNLPDFGPEVPAHFASLYGAVSTQ
jgi:hypothetical protein